VEGHNRAKKHYHEKNGAPGYSFVPFSVETYGRLEKDAQGVLRDMAERAACAGDCDRDCFVNWMVKEISLSFIRGNT
jgi:hypothetical protein